MSVFGLKTIAAIAMLLDHIGYAADIGLLRCIGRLAFPIYAFLIGNGLRHTTSPPRYLARLVLLALLSQIPYALFILDSISIAQLNVFVTLSLGLLTLLILEGDLSAPQKLLCCSIVLVICLCLEHTAPPDYGVRGVLLIVALYYCPQPRTMAAAFFLIYYLPLWDTLLQEQPLQPGHWYSLCAVLALPLLQNYNGTSGPHAKPLQWFFYLFYPLHLLLLHLVLP